jgi:hypothetical protein
MPKTRPSPPPTSGSARISGRRHGSFSVLLQWGERGGLLVPAPCHLTWSLLVLCYLPPLFGAGTTRPVVKRSSVHFPGTRLGSCEVPDRAWSLLESVLEFLARLLPVALA